ncbi:hypothetical protein BCR32DRAFT_270053 [Anaeromyces robustus]|uniref:Uncharacterized protein n=1 Tax=Anaeromyces robustus TaxID=1754192 RepID=A0A1Y1WYL2_9FUNG|nr:hypothetical protein BCR32DRAFT_270053 [Anaeromyces robustus]|eukprot:ORX78485.1 hypothetical protein BCR32DRAFT_270053 [Anaeromyces robustus]
MYYLETNYTITDVENIKVKTNYVCPDDSSSESPSYLTTKTGEEFTVCKYNYYCHKNSYCIKSLSQYSLAKDYINNFYGSYIINKENPTKKMIILSCNKKTFKNKICTTDSCDSNSDCFSDNCVDGVCMINPDDPVYVCGTTKENSQFKVKCLLNYQENCKSDEECGDNTFCRLGNICLDKRTTIDHDLKKYLIPVVILIIISLIIFVLYQIEKNNIKEKKNKKGKNNLNEIN